MKFKAKCVIVAMENIKTKKGNEYAKVLLVDSTSTDTVTVLSEDLTIMEQPFYTPVNCLFDYNEKSQWNNLKLLAFEVAK